MRTRRSAKNQDRLYKALGGKPPTNRQSLPPKPTEVYVLTTAYAGGEFVAVFGTLGALLVSEYANGCSYVEDWQGGGPALLSDRWPKYRIQKAPVRGWP